MKDNIIDELIYQVSNHLDRLRSLSPSQIRDVILELKKEIGVWNQLASGNRDYFEAALKNNTDKYFLGAVPHLEQALSHRLGFIASSEQKNDTIGDPVFDNVILGRLNLKQLKPQELVQFLRDFLNSGDLRKVFGMFGNYSGTVNTWVTSYDKKHAKEAASAYAYMEEKREKIMNLFIKTIFPQMMGAIAKSKMK
jgi:hypothetical protein